MFKVTSYFTEMWLVQNGDSAKEKKIRARLDRMDIPTV